MLNIGSHLSVTKGYESMGKRAKEMGANTFQFFSRNPRGGNSKEIDRDDIKRLEEFLIKENFAPLLTHAPYTLNMAGQKDSVFDFAKKCMREDLEKLENIPSNLFNFHPGSSTSMGTKWGLERIINGLNEVMYKECTTTVLLEVMAGKGTEIGSKFEEIAFILNNVDHQEKYGVCLDTCHLHEAGYDIKNDFSGVLDEFQRIIGLEKIKAIHLNDSKNPRGAHKDRHEKIGQGEIGLEAIVNIITEPRLQGIPFFLETPNDEEGYKEEIKLLRELYNGHNK